MTKKHKDKLLNPPCTVLKYCPYGVLVEQFDLADPDDEKRCPVYGHICPVYEIRGESGNHDIEDAA